MHRFYTFLLMFISLTSFAEGMRIKGIVKDLETKKPVKGVSVVITFYKGFEFSDVTDSLGQFEIVTTAVVPEGDYTIQFNAKNYWEMGGFVHVTKDCARNFFIKAKVEDTTQPEVKNEVKTEVKKDTVRTAVKKDTTTILVGLPDLPKLTLEGYATNNLVFLIDISSSMNSPEKMPLVKESLKYLINELRPTDKVAILTFSSVVKEVLPSTQASDKAMMLKTIDELSFGNTTQGGAAMSMAYKTAVKNSIQKGNNRIVLISDGLFTSGEKDYQKMQQTIEAGLDKNISLSIFCFGKTTEYVNAKLKKLSTTGNGNYAVITTLDIAKENFLKEAKALKSE